MEDKTVGYINGINGSVITINGSPDFKMREMVIVGNSKLIGEVIAIRGEDVIAQVYEITTGLKLNEPVIGTKKPLSVTLGPGIIGNIFDGIQRPLEKIRDLSGAYINRGLTVDRLDTDKKWDIEIKVKKGDYLTGGSVIGEIQESEAVIHKVMVPPFVEGEVIKLKESGSYTINEVLAVLKDKRHENEIRMLQEWPVREARPYKDRQTPKQPLITGQRVFDTMFPIAKGGTGAIPGGFGTGKTMTQHQFAKWSDADIIVYIGCGERGNEITEVLEDFPELIDPKTKRPLMERTILIANTSNMPVAAREASIYTGTTLAEYYRDMGYHVAIMADSTSRWAEALREISGRLEEMPAEEGFPAYLSSRLSEFYERAGFVTNLNESEGSLTVIGAVSPQGSDFSEPVTMNTKRFVRCFWALDKQLAYERHYPAVNWSNSYSEYIDELALYYKNNVAPDFMEKRTMVSALLQEESKLMEIVKLIGSDILPDEQKLVLESCKVLRQGFLQQNAFHEDDTYVPIKKQYLMMDLILKMHEKAKTLVAKGIPVSVIRKTEVFNDLIKMKYSIDNTHLEKFKELETSIFNKLNELSMKYER
ncbi:MAG: V-type ATP synthase subunit A [Clostridia bacterium]|nr:V-type ATP synthase subunit A [Clostridia bacterium]